MKKYLECGKIVSTHGIKGELKVQVWADTPDFILDFDTLYLNKGEKALKVLNSRLNKAMALIVFEGINSIDEARLLKDKVLYADREDIEMEEGDYFIQDLIGLEVVDADTSLSYGKLSDVSQTGANDVYHIMSEDKKERLVPAIPQVVISIDIDEKIMIIRPLEGLFDEI